MEENEKNLAKNTFFLYVMQISGYIFPLLTFPYLTRVLGPNNYGVVIFSNAVMQYFTIFIEFGFLLSATNACSQYRNDIVKLSNITFSVIYAKFLLAVVSLFVLIFCCCFVDAFKVSRIFFVLSYIAIVLTVLLPDFLFRGIEKMSILTYRVIFSKFVYTGLIFVLVHKPEDYIYVPVATIGGNLLSVILTWFELCKKKYIQVVRISVKDIFLSLREASTFFLSRVAVTAFSTLNTVLLGIKYSNSDMGQYGSANTLTQTCRNMMSPIADSIFPYMIKNKNFKLIKRIIFILEPIIILGCVCLWFLSPWVIRVICGKGYDGAVVIFRLMLPYLAIGLPNSLIGYPVLGAIGKIRMANLSVVYASIFHLVSLLILFLLKRLTLNSVVVLMCVTEYLIFFIRLFVITKYKNVDKHSRI